MRSAARSRLRYPIAIATISYIIILPITVLVINSNFGWTNTSYLPAIIYALLFVGILESLRQRRRWLIFIYGLAFVVVSAANEITSTTPWLDLIYSTLIISIIGAETYLPAMLLVKSYRRAAKPKGITTQSTVKPRTPMQPTRPHQAWRPPPVIRWPDNAQYVLAIQNPNLSFKDDELRNGKVELNKLGLPKVVCGAFALVFKLSLPNRYLAIRCFSRKPAGTTRERYDKLNQYLMKHSMAFLVPFEYLHQGIRIGTEYYPIVKMQWIEGMSLDQFVHVHKKDRKIILDLADDFFSVIAEMRRVKMAHGDLQHGNIIVLANRELRLVDYDCMFIPSFNGYASPEIGHRHYQPLGRTESDYSEEMDSFSAVVIYLSLRAIALEPQLFDMFYNGENLIFTRDDFRDTKSSELFKHLKNHNDELIKRLSNELEKHVNDQPSRMPPLEKIARAK